MKPSQEDQNNHVPELSSEDEWDNFELEADSAKSPPPPLQDDAILPPKKDLKPVNVTHYEARSKVGDNNSEIISSKGEVPAAPDGKSSRFRVREIAPGKDSGASSRGIPKSAPNISNHKRKGSSDKVARRRRRLVSGERNDWGENEGRNSMKWMLYSGVGLVLLMILAVFLSQRISQETERESDRPLYKKLVASEDEVDDDSILIELSNNNLDEARDIYAAFVTAKSISDFSDFLYAREKILPFVEGQWEPSGKSEGWRPRENSTWTTLEQDETRYGVLEGRKEDFTRFSAFFRHGESGLELDWKATVGYSTASFDKLTVGKGDGSEIRAWISPSDFYTYAFPENKYRSYRLMSPNEDHTLWGYTELEGELGKKLRDLFAPRQITGEVQSRVQAVISLERGPDESLPNQWIIKDLVRLTWLDK